MNRGASHEPVFLNDYDRTYFIELLSEIDEKFGVEVHAYCLMGNHYHLLLFSRTPNLSEAMHWVASCYSRRFNWLHGFDGSPFRGRFLAKPVDTDEYLVAVARYIHRNPEDLGFGGKLASYRWSSLAVYLGRGGPGWVHASNVLAASGGACGYLEFVERESSVLDDIAESGPTRPSEASLWAAMSDSPPTSLDDLADRVKLLYNLTEDPCRKAERGVQNKPRLLALTVAADVMGASGQQLADRFGFKNAASARSAVSKARAQIHVEPLAKRTQTVPGTSWVRLAEGLVGSSNVGSGGGSNVGQSDV